MIFLLCALRTAGVILYLSLIVLDGTIRRPRTLLERASWMQAWSKRTMRFMRMRLVVQNAPASPRAVVANHVSYLDIMAMGAERPTVLIAKQELRSWPLVGYITATAGTIYVDRSSRTSTAQAGEQMKQAMQEGLSVAFFPEGTSSDGTDILPFHAPFFQPLVEADVEIWPAHLSYKIENATDSATRVPQEVAYWGEMHFPTHLFHLQSLGPITCTLRYAEEPIQTSDRKSAAKLCHAAVSGLGLSQQLAIAESAKYLLHRPVEGVSPLHHNIGTGA